MVTVLRIFVFGLCLASCGSFQCNSKRVATPKALEDTVNSFALDQEASQRSLLFMTESPHVFSSPRQGEVRDHILSRLRAMNLEGTVQNFSVETPRRKLDLVSNPTETRYGSNVFVRLNLVENPQCLVALGSHYDTKDMESFPYLGANDSASSSILLLDLARFLSLTKVPNLKCDIVLIWFDGEEAVLANWNDGKNKHPAKIQDNTYGSRHFAKDLVPCACKGSLCEKPRFAGFVLLDMLGYHDLHITLDFHSSPKLRSLLVSASEFLNNKDVISENLQSIEDDHIPFKEKGVPVLNIIDFNHLALWHTEGDIADTVSMKSLEFSGKLALYVILNLASSPEFYTDSKTPCLQHSL